ncbi:MAG: hypothetical protein ACFFH0_00130 [Promethearchaeota archaeon]
MVNKEKALKRELVRLRKTQNPQQVDSRRIRKMLRARAKLRSENRKVVVVPKIEKEKKPKAKKPRRKKEPELEIIEDEPELEIIEEIDQLVLEEKKKARKPKKKKEPELEVIEDEPVVEEKKKPKKKKEPELEVIEDEPDDDFIDEELADLYTYDEDIDEEELD